MRLMCLTSHAAIMHTRRPKAGIRFLFALTRWPSSKYGKMIGTKPAKRFLRSGLGRYVHAA